MINWPDCWKEKKKNKLISENHQDLERIPIMDGGEKLLFGYKNIKNSIVCFALHAMPSLTMSNVSEL